MRHVYESRSNALTLIVREVARWQAQHPPLRDDAKDRAIFEAKVAEIQHRLVREYRIGEDVPKAKVSWEGVGRRAPEVFLPPDPPSPAEIERREKLIASLQDEAQRGQVDVAIGRREAVIDALGPIKRGKWVSAALMPWTGSHPDGEYERMRTAVEERANQAVEEAVAAVIALYQSRGA